jgi:hypothetical protein
MNKTCWQAHRAAWTLFVGEIPNGMNVLHRCDVRNCINPDHLFIGTQQDNVADMIKKKRDRKAKGQDSGRTLLSDNDILPLKSVYKDARLKVKELASRLGLAEESAWDIARGRSWKHLNSIAEGK